MHDMACEFRAQLGCAETISANVLKAINTAAKHEENNNETKELNSFNLCFSVFLWFILVPPPKSMCKLNDNHIRDWKQTVDLCVSMFTVILQSLNSCEFVLMNIHQ